MADLIAELAAKAGVSSDMAGKGVGSILALLKDKLPAGIFNQVQAAVPNANSLMTADQPAKEASGGIVETVTSAIGKLFGGGGAAETANKLAHLGFSADQIQKFLPKVLEFFKSKLPEDVTKQVSKFLPTGESGN
jgi:hypothetical protein